MSEMRSRLRSGPLRAARARRLTCKPHSPRRLGATLALVAVIVALVSLLAATLTTSAWRANRASTMSRMAQDMVRAVDVAAANALRAWGSDSVAQRPLGVTVHRADQSLPEATVRAAWRRTHPLFVWLELDATSQSVHAARRHERRAYWLRPPPIPVPAALTSGGMVEGEDGVLVSGVDVATPSAWCPGNHPTPALAPALSRPAVVAGDVEAAPARLWATMPVWRAVTASEQAALGYAWTAVLSRMAGQVVGSSAQSPVSDPGWRALRLDGDTVVLRGPAIWHGLLVVNGALRIEGAVEIRGLLMARRTLDATAAALVVEGAMIAGSASSDVVRLSPFTRVRLDRCAIDLALATIAAPRAAPLGLRMPLGLW